MVSPCSLVAWSVCGVDVNAFLILVSLGVFVRVLTIEYSSIRYTCNVDVLQAHVTDLLDGEITVALDNRLIIIHSVRTVSIT